MFHCIHVAGLQLFFPRFMQFPTLFYGGQQVQTLSKCQDTNRKHLQTLLHNMGLC